MTSPLKALLAIAVAECVNTGCANYEIIHGCKHEKFKVTGLKGSRTVTISRSPSCQFVGKKVRRNVQHALKEVGYEL